MRPARTPRRRFDAPPKQQVTLRIDAELLARYRSLGKGYQRVMEDVLRAAAQDKIRVPWTEEEDAFLRVHYRQWGARGCASELQRSVQAIQHRARLLQLQGVRGRPYHVHGYDPPAARDQRVDAMRDEDIDLSDNPEVTREMFARAKTRRRGRGR